jgi:hypothetical protein
VVDSQTWTGSDCIRFGGGNNSLRCKKSAAGTGFGSQIRFPKRSAASFFRVVISVRNESFFSPAAGDTPLHITLTTSGGVDRSDAIDTCQQKANRLVCKDIP